MSGKSARVKRFYKSVSVRQAEDDFALFLDERPARTARDKPISAPAEKLARAVADEWAGQDEFIDRRAMPMTALLCAAIDGGEEAAAWRDEALNYLGTDLLCYRADSPQALAERQTAGWAPYLDWLRLEFGAAMVATKGVAAVGQPDAAIAAVRRALDGQSAPTLFAIKTAAAITGSAILALALWKRAFEPDAIFNASRIDEHFQEERSGPDVEAKAREQEMRREFLCLAKFFALLSKT